MAALEEGKRLYDGLLGEVQTPQRYSRDEVIVLAGNNVAVLAVLGKITKAVPTDGLADAGNTGDGTCENVVGGDDTQLGTYRVVCVEAIADGGRFRVIGPNGEALPDAEVGVAYENPQIEFDLVDAAADFAVGDEFTIAVAKGSEKVKPIDFVAVDGSQQACGIACDNYDATDADVRGVAIVRDAAFMESVLVWPDGATEEQKAKALAELKAAGVLMRTSA